MMWVGNIAGICEFRPTGKGLTFTISTFRQHFENDAIVHRKATNEYFQYLFGPRDCSRTKSARYGQTPQELTYATVPRRLYSTRSFGSTGLSFRPGWPAVNGYSQREYNKLVFDSDPTILLLLFPTLPFQVRHQCLTGRADRVAEVLTTVGIDPAIHCFN